MDQTDRVYKSIILDVIENVKEDFKREGIDESILMEMQRIWELKINAQQIDSSQDLTPKNILKSISNSNFGRPEPTIPPKKKKIDDVDQIDGQEDEELGSEDDDKEDEIPDTNNIILCQHEKSSKPKGKWKFKLVQGFVKINGKDSLFHDGNCELEW